MTATLRPSPEVVAVAAHKGGVGKTTTATALAAALARFRQASVLLVDLDPQGHSSVGLDVAVDPAWTVRELLAERHPAPLARVCYATGVDRLAVVPATIGLERAARGMLSVMLRRALAPAAGRFDWVILDCPPSLGSLVENALVAATRVLVPVRAEARGADGLVDLLDVLELLNEPARGACRILRTQRNESHSIANSLIEDALEPYRDRVLQTIIPQCSDLNQAQAHRQDIFTYAPRSTGAAAYAQLAGEVMGVHA
jgi:chromosome partitioning protein